MAAGQPLRGLVAQSMSGQRKKVAAMTRVYPPGTYTFTAPKTGLYEFAGWNCGRNQKNTGYSVSGAFGLRQIRMGRGQSATLNVGSGDEASGSAGSAGANTVTSIAFPDGRSMTWTDGDNTTGAVAAVTGGDVNISGNASNSVAVGAPSYGHYVGGQPGGLSQPGGPGSGGYAGAQVFGSPAQIIVTLVGPNLLVS